LSWENPSCMKGKQSKANMCYGRRHVPLCQACANKKLAEQKCIILHINHPHLSDFCSRLRLTQPYNHIINPGVAKIYLHVVLFWKCLLYLLILLFLASCSIHLQFWVQKKIFLNHSDIYYRISNFRLRPLVILSCYLSTIVFILYTSIISPLVRLYLRFGNFNLLSIEVRFSVLITRI